MSNNKEIEARMKLCFNKADEILRSRENPTYMTYEQTSVAVSLFDGGYGTS